MISIASGITTTAIITLTVARITTITVTLITSMTRDAIVTHITLTAFMTLTATRSTTITRALIPFITMISIVALSSIATIVISIHDMLYGVRPEFYRNAIGTLPDALQDADILNTVFYMTSIGRRWW